MKPKILVTALISIGFSLSGACLAAPPAITKPNASIAAPDKTQIPAATGSEAGQSLDKKPGGITIPGKSIIPKMNNSAGNDGGLAMPGRSDGNSHQGGSGIVTVPGQSGGSRPGGVGGLVIPDGSGSGGSHKSGVGGFAIPGGSGGTSRPGGVGGFAIPGGSESGGGNVTVPGRSGGSSNHGSADGIGRPGAEGNSGRVRIRGGETREGDETDYYTEEMRPGGIRAIELIPHADDKYPVRPGPGVGESRYEYGGPKPDPKPDNDSGTPNDNDMGSGGSTKLKGRVGDLDKPVRNEEMGSGGSQKISKDKGTTDGTGDDESGDSKNIGNSLSQGKNPLINPVDR